MGTSSSKKKQHLKIGSSKYKVISIQSTSDIVTELIVAETKTKEEYFLKKMLINSGSNTIDYLSCADILSRLPSHPNIVRYVGSSHFVHQDGSIEFALLTENSSAWLHLNDLMEQKLLHDFKLKLKAFEDICQAIQHCHINSIAHLSIHPANVVQDGFGTFKITNFDSSVIINNGLCGLGSSGSVNRNSVFSNNMQHYPNININAHNSNNYESKHDDSSTIFIAPELLDPKQYTAVIDNKLFEKGDIWSLGCLLLYLLYDGTVPKWYTNKLGVREADCSMFLGSTASNFVKTKMIHSNPYKRITISQVLKFISDATEYNDPIRFLSALNDGNDSKHSTPHTEAGKHGKNRRKRKVNKNSSMYNNPIDSMINKILKTNSQIFYNRLMVNFWDNNADKQVVQHMVERVYMSASVICNRSSLTGIKLLTLLHRLFLQTPQQFMSVSIIEIRFYNQLIEFWKVDQSHDFMKDLVISYAKFMINRLKFHSKNEMFESNFSLSLYMYTHQKNNYICFHCNKWFDDISQSFIDLISFGSNHCSVINSILSHKGFNINNNGNVGVGNILNNCLIPLFEDLHSLYLITTWIIGLLRISFGKKKTSIYSDKYKDFMISLIAVVTRIKNVALRVWNCIDIDTKQFPKHVPKISSIALLDIYPPSSFAPNLSAFNRELVNYFVNIINQENNNNKLSIKPDSSATIPIRGDQTYTHLSLKRSKTQKDVNQEPAKQKHGRSRSTNLDKNGPSAHIFNSSPNVTIPFPPTPSILNQLSVSSGEHARLHPTIQIEQIDQEMLNLEDEEEDEVKEELSFRALSRSISSDTNIGLHNTTHPTSPVNPFATLHSDEIADILTNRAISTSFESSSTHSSVYNGHMHGHDNDDILLIVNNEHKIEEEAKVKVAQEDELRWADLIIIERIGIGGFAEVFSGKMKHNLASQDEFSESDDDEEGKVAIKKLINQNLTQHNLSEFSSEIEIMRRIKHPNITKFIGACTKAPHMCIVTELLAMSLFDLLHNTRVKLSVDKEIKIAFGATKGVSHLHENDIIHRDLKSANILLDKHYEPRLTDFGLSRMKDQSTLTAGTGTFQWMAPEVIQGKKYDEKSDIYSLAMIFWELKTSLIPFISYRLNGIQASVAVVTQKKRPRIDVKIFKNKTNYNEWKDLIITMWNQTASLRPSAKDVIKLLQQF